MFSKSMKSFAGNPFVRTLNDKNNNTQLSSQKLSSRYTGAMVSETGQHELTEQMDSFEMDIKEVNMTYLMLSQSMLRSDRATALLKLGCSEEVAELIESLTPGQVLQMASSGMLLCQFRFDNQLIVNLLSNHELKRGNAQIHAAIIAAKQCVASI